MARTARCPQCKTRNAVPRGTVGINCKACGAPIRINIESLESSWEHSSGNVFDRLERTLSQPKGIIIGSAVMLVLFAAFWGFLHWQLSPGKPAAAPSPLVAQTSAPVPVSVQSQAPAPLTAPPAAPTAPVVAATAPASTQPVVSVPIPHPLPSIENAVSDKKLRQAIARGEDYLIKQFDPATHMAQISAQPYANGGDMLCVYALLQCNDSVPDQRLTATSPFMKDAIAAMINSKMDARDEIYGRSLRANALAMIDLPMARAALEKDVIFLGRAARQGAYTYVMPTGPPNDPISWDNSNSQYGVLGVWAGAEAGMPIPSSYWKAVQQHWIDCQSSDGSFGYSQGSGGKLSMTVAGVASLCIAHDYLAGSSPTPGDAEPAAVARALTWLNTGDNLLSIDNSGSYFDVYCVYGIARAGLASGYKFFGKHDWYTELARDPLKNQMADGSFREDPITTAFTLLFLARGMHPVLFTKLSVDGVAMNHPRDVANLARYASRELEHTFNAQIVPLSHPWLDWTDSPVIYLAASTAPYVSDDQCEQIREFVQAGGLLFTNADDNSKLFDKFADQLAQRLFPDYPFANLPLDHPLYTALFRLKPPPPLKAVSNGARLLMVHSPKDVAKSWDIHDWTTVEPGYQLGVNIFLYAAGTRDFRNRLDSNYVPPPPAAPAPEVSLSVARLQYSGNWDPEPYAWTRFSRQFRWNTSFALDVKPIDIGALTPATAPIADLTGVDARQFTDAQVVVLREYVRQGGVLLIDSCGGAAGFASSQNTLLEAMIPSAQATALDPSHPLLSAGGPCMDALPRAQPRVLGTPILPPGMIRLGRGHIIVTSRDLTCGLLDTATLGINGYDPAYAEAFVKNLILWTWNGQHDQ